MSHGGAPRHPAAAANHAFRKVEVLEGNVGYVRFDGFNEGPEAEATAAAALAFLANADALVFDLRFNGGGSPAMIRFITSYLFDQRTHLNDMVDRTGKIVEEFWTLEEIPGRRFRNDLPVYVLTSANTFSGAEEFAYNLKALGRGTIVGEKTGGGAHPTAVERLDGRFVISVPFMRAMNPITKTNWEQKGVEPDLAVAAEAALDRALAEARAGGRGPKPAAAASAAESRPFALMVGDPAPKLQADRWLKGSPIAEFQRGRAYVIEFWATWCGPCKAGIPHLTKIQAKHPDKLTVVGISVWEPRDRDVDPFVKDWDDRMRYTVAVDQVVGVDTQDEEQRSRQAVEKGLISKAWLVDSGSSYWGIPQAFLVDGEGKIAWMGDPTQIDGPLEQVIAGTWDRAAAAASHRAKMEFEAFARPVRAKAQDARRAGKLEAALEHVDAILAKGESPADAVLKFKLLVGLKRHADALALYERAAPKLEWHQTTNMMNTLAYEGRGLTPEAARAAIAACESALRQLGRDDAWPLMVIAELRHRLGQKAEALAAIDRALAIAPEESKAQALEARKKYERGGGSMEL
jgi:thiol-disulfide isomerase/thioredoxin